MVASGQDCAGCIPFVMKLAAHLVTPELIKTESDLFKQNLCNGDDHCVKQVDEYWPDMAQALFRFPDTPKNICEGNKFLCGITDVNCTICKQGMNEIRNVFETSKMQKQVELIMSGPLFCDHVPETEKCAAFVQKHAGKAMSIVGGALVAASEKNCVNVMGTSCTN